MVFIIILVVIIAVYIAISIAQVKAPVPAAPWRLFNSRKAFLLDEDSIKKLQGVYTITNGNEFFGDLAVLKWSCIIEDGKSTHQLSILLGKDAGYFICIAKKFRNKILLNGYWSKVKNSETGNAQFMIAAKNGANEIFDLPPSLNNNAITITGRFSKRNHLKWSRIILKFQRPLNNKFPFRVLAHRGAGTNYDFYPVSENSLESIKMSALLGATGLEVDVRLTADNIPVLFHDFVLSTRSMDNYILAELLNSKSYSELKELRLKKGEIMPTLRDALDTILYKTLLDLVWLDIKYDGDLQVIAEIQQEYHKKALDANRNLKIYIGIPDNAALKKFSELPGYKNISSLIELDAKDAHEYNADIWAPKWTTFHDDDIEKMKKEGKMILTWTLDEPENIKHFMFEKKFDGILSNVPSLVAFYYYTA